MTIDEIKAIVSKRESLTLECKTVSNSLPRSLWETYSAFANTVGGIILLGVEEHKSPKNTAKRFTFEGVSDPHKIISDFWNTINSDTVNVNVLHNNSTNIFEIDGKLIISIEVPQAKSTDKPVFINGNPYKGSYKRNNEGDYHCTEEEVKAMIRDSASDGNDGMLLENYDMDDIDIPTLQSFRSYFRVVNPDHAWNFIDDDKIFLRNFGAYTTDRITRKEGLTVAGLMMFGKGLSIRERFANFRMDYVDMSRLVGQERYKDRLTYDGRWENNLYQFFRYVIPKLTFDMPRPFRLENGIQRVDDTLQIGAIREAFTNSIIHCDFFIDGGILRIEKHDDYLCLRNPGLLKIPVEQVYEGGISSARNPRIQHLFRMIGYGENLGSGFPKILYAWQQTDWKLPELINKTEQNETELRLYVPFELEKETEIGLELDVQQTENQADIVGVAIQTPSCPPGQNSQTPSSTSGQIAVYQQKIIEFCQSPKSISEIAEMLGLKDKKSVRKKYVAPLVGTKLELTIPNRPSSSKQKYQTIKHN